MVHRFLCVLIPIAIDFQITGISTLTDAFKAIVSLPSIHRHTWYEERKPCYLHLACDECSKVKKSLISTPSGVGI